MTELTAEKLTQLRDKLLSGDMSPRRLDAEIDAVLRIGTTRMRKEAQWAYNNFPNWSAKESKPGVCQTDEGGIWWESDRFTTSLDAAESLHEAFLPGPIWLTFVGMCATIGVNGEEYTGRAKNKARAWVIAILSAMIAGDAA